MQLAMIGLGRMGGDLVRRLLADGHECIVHDVDPAAVRETADAGATGTDDLAGLVAALRPPRVIWVMVPAAVVDTVLADLVPLLDADDLVIDGGNTLWTHDLRRHAELDRHGVRYVDIGTSGGVHGRERGYCLMVGGDDDAVARLTPVLDTLAPGVDAAPRTPGRAGDPLPEERGWLHCGPSGAGHFVKMVHNGIEYGMMAALAEGLALLERADLGREDRAADAETAPLAEPEAYRYDLDLAAITELWRRGSVVGSWLLDLTAGALHADPGLDGFEGRVSDSGEGRWTVQAAVDLGFPAQVITASLFQRFATRGNDETTGKVLSAMRHAFGGHVEVPGEPGEPGDVSG